MSPADAAGRHHIETQPWVPMVLAREAAGLSTVGLATDAVSLMEIACPQSSAAARGLAALGVRG